MAWSIVKKKKSLEVTLEQALKNVDGRVDLREEILGIEIAIVVLASFKDNPSFPKDKSQWKDGGKTVTAMDALIAIMQPAPLRRQEVRDHN
jgi:hypothetical protein